MSKTHGTRSYYNSGCRCDDCRTANNTYMVQYMSRRSKLITQTPFRRGHTWEPWEDELVKDYSKNAEQIALILRRTPSAITNRRRGIGMRRKS